MKHAWDERAMRKQRGQGPNLKTWRKLENSIKFDIK